MICGALTHRNAVYHVEMLYITCRIVPVFMLQWSIIFNSTIVVYKTRVSAQFAKAHFAPTLVLYTNMMMKQYHYKHFYANLDFDHFS